MDILQQWPKYAIFDQISSVGATRRYSQQNKKKWNNNWLDTCGKKCNLQFTIEQTSNS